MSGKYGIQPEEIPVIAYLSLGSNLGDREENMKKAEEFIEMQIGHVIQKSSLYETAPWGNKDQGHFLNEVIKLETKMNPVNLLKSIHEIEAGMGRIRSEKWQPRIMDIDILFYNSQIIKDKELVIPHPFIEERRFVLLPMAEINPGFIHPVFKLTISDLLNGCRDTSEVLLYKS